MAIRRVRGKSLVYQIPAGALTATETSKLRHLLGSEARELMFSKKVIFVEGDAELGALPILYESIHHDLDREGVSLVPIDGKHFAKFVKVARALGIPFSVLCDRDALESVETSIDGPAGKVPCSVVLSQLHELGEISYKRVARIWKLAKLTPAGGKSRLSYPPEIVAKLIPIAVQSRVFVWASDLEGALEAAVSSPKVEEIKRDTKSKVVRGRLLAASIVENKPLPAELDGVLGRLIRMRARGED